MEKAKQREVFKTCMEERGYKVIPPGGSPEAAKAAEAMPVIR
jgi:hypothetical protein